METHDSCFIIVKEYPCDDPYYPPNDSIYRIFINEKDALQMMYNIYDSIHDEFENDLKQFHDREKTRHKSEKNSFLRSFTFPRFTNYKIIKYDILRPDVSGSFATGHGRDDAEGSEATGHIESLNVNNNIRQPHKEIFNLIHDIINPDLTITPRYIGPKI